MSAAAQPRYTAVAIALHWLIALGIIGMIGLGWYMGDLEDRAQQYALTQLHKSFGITILLLSVARLIWRLANPPPEEPPMPPWQAMTARVTHIAFYVLIIAMPLTGWIMVSASPTEIPTRLFQTIPWAHIPGLPNLSDEAKEAFAVPIEFTHSKLAWVAIVLLVIHVAAALKHQFLDKDNLLVRMIPGVFGRTSGPPQPSRGYLAAFGAALIILGIAAAGALMGRSNTPPAPSAQESVAEAAPDASIAETAPQPQESETAAAENARIGTDLPDEPAPEAEATASELAQQENPSMPQSAPSAPDPIPTWTVDYANSELGFTGAYMGRGFAGRFETWTAQIAFDPARPAEADIRVEITMNSVATGEPFYDENVVLGDWFDVRNHPTAVFTADSAASLGDDRYRAAGQLSIRETDRPLALDFSLSISGDTAEVEGEAKVQRLDFAVGADTLTEPRGEEDWVADEVTVTIDLVAVRD